MKRATRSKIMQVILMLTGAFVVAAGPALAQDYAPPPSFSRSQVDSLVSRIALYPDPLLAQVFAAASFPDQVGEASRWADQYRNLRGGELADAIYQANLPFDPAVQALIPFPTVLHTMASDLNWTNSLGNAVLADRREVMEAVQRMRRSAAGYGYLRSNPQIRVVDTGADVEIEPVDPSLIYVPEYDPYVVYAPPRAGFYVGNAIGFGSCYSLGGFGGWGWGGGFNWYNHDVLVGNSVWGRTWYNRGAYEHNYGNWARGEWRESYGNRGNRGFAQSQNASRYDNRYSNSGNSSRGGGYDQSFGHSSNAGRSYQGGQAPVTRSSGYDQSYSRGSSNAGSSYQGTQAAPMTQSRGYDQSYGRGSSNAGSSYQGSQPAPVTQSRGYDQSYGRGSSNAGSPYQGGQAAPVTQSRGYDQSYSRRSSNAGSSYQGGQAAPVTQSRGYDQSYSRGSNNAGSSYQGGQAASMTQSRGNDQSYSRGSSNTGSSYRGNGGGYSDRGAGRRP